MVEGEMTQGELCMLAGGALAAVGLVLLLTGLIGFGIKKSRIKKKLYDRYGFFVIIAVQS